MVACETRCRPFLLRQTLWRHCCQAATDVRGSVCARRSWPPASVRPATHPIGMRIENRPIHSQNCPAWLSGTLQRVGELDDEQNAEASSAGERGPEGTDELPRIAAVILAWDGEDLNNLLPPLQRSEAIPREQGLSTGADEDDEVMHALTDAGAREDLPWPSPWGRRGVRIRLRR